MAIEQVNAARVPPAAALREAIAKHRRASWVAVSGLAPLLEVLDAYVVQTDARIADLERRLNAKSVMREMG